MRHFTKINTAIILLFSIVFLFSACENEKYTIVYNFTKGEVLKQKMVIDTETSTMGQKVDGKMEMDLSYKVKDIQNESYILDLKYDALKLSIPMLGTTLDSNTPDDVISLQNMSPMLKLFTKQSYEMKMNNIGKVEYIKGFDDLQESFAGAFDESIPEELRTQMIDQIGKQFSVDGLQATIEQTSAFLPKTPVSVGDSWTFESLIKMNIPCKINANFTLKKVENDIATIAVDGTVETDEGFEQDFNGIKLTYSLKGTQKGENKIDLKTGWVVESSIVQNIIGDVNVAGTKGNMSIITTTKVTN